MKAALVLVEREPSYLVQIIPHEQWLGFRDEDNLSNIGEESLWSVQETDRNSAFLSAELEAVAMGFNETERIALV